MSAFTKQETVMAQEIAMAQETVMAQDTLGFASQAIIQNKSKQDFATYGRLVDENNIECMFIVVADGHGNGVEKDNVINFIRMYNWKKHLKNLNWYDDFSKNIKFKLPLTTGTGSTLSVIRVYSDKFQCWWIGDSSIRIYDEDGEIWRMLDHDVNNAAEVERLKSLGYPILKEFKPCILTKTTMTMDHALRIDLGRRDRLAMTKALGHDEKTGIDITYEEVGREVGKKYRLIAATDGFWDVVSNIDVALFKDKKQFNTADNLAVWSLKKWKQPWTYLWKDTTQISKFPESNIDDIGIVVWDC